jgi:uncharacterized membrane protein HdeD (DUF308 family)
MLSNVLSRYWWMTVVRGIAWILFGVLVFAQPGISLLALALTFGVFALADGIGHVVSAFGGRREYKNWWVLLLTGLAGIVVGVITFVSPGVTALGLLYYVAIWAIATGVLAIVVAVNLRKEIRGEFWLGLGGLLSIVFGMFLVARPGEGALTVLWLIGSYAIAFGVILLMLAFKARTFVHRLMAAMKGPTPASTR